jgi:signal transduction histidine kinase
VLGVLDIQVDHYNAMFDHDKSTVVALAKLVSRELETISLLGLTRQERDFIDLIASKFLSLQDLKDILIEIARVSNEIFHANICVLYVRDLTTGELVLEQCTGVNVVDMITLVGLAEDATPLINDFVSNTTTSVWFTSLDELINSLPFAQLDKNTATKLMQTLQKEKISAVAAINFYVEEDSVGALILGFQDSVNLPVNMSFSDLVGFMQSTFARLAATIIERAQATQRQTQVEKNKMQVLLHDNLISHLHIADQMLIESTKSDRNNDFYNLIIMAQEQLDHAMRTVEFLDQNSKVDIKPTWEENLEQVVSILNAFNVMTVVNCSQEIKVAPRISFVAGAVLFEAAVNAVRHSSLSEFRISCKVENGCLNVIMEDDGGGGSYINEIQATNFSIRNRVKSVGGTLELRRNNKDGITIDVRLPAI